jgi:ectoine hydroxylase-related dioxygenase (phytanoyl-CoA dioxygenase family)
MKTDLSPSQISAYQENGFLVVPDFLELQELQELRAGVDAAVEQLGNRRITGGELDWVDDDSYYTKVFKQRLNLWRINKAVKAVVLSPELGQMAARLAGVDGVRVWHDQALIKEPYANPTAWHLDNPYWSFHSKNSISIWIALDDATPENGCLYFLPGTHRRARFDNANIGQNIADLFKIYPEFLTVASVSAPMKAGSASFHNGLCAHGAGANMTNGYRRAMTCAYMPIGSVFNGKHNVLPERYLKTLSLGAVLDDDNLNPVVYAGQQAS